VDYYIAARGNDKHSGAKDAPWKSIARLNRAKLTAGDRVLFQGGSRFKGKLELTKAHSGKPGRPVVIGSFGRGLATIDGSAEGGCLMDNVSDLRLDALKFRGPGWRKMVRLSGVVVLGGKRVEITRLDVRDFPLHGVVIGGGLQPRVTHCRMQDNGSAGMVTWNARGWIKDLYVGHCIFENNPGTKLSPKSHSGSGLIVAGAKGALVEHCRASRNGWAMPRKGNGPVGIWVWKADRVVIQHCLSYGNRSPGWDGGGFDFDGGVTNSVMQFNLSYGNIGCGYGMYQFPKAPLWKNNILRFNISYLDGQNREGAALHFWTGDSKRQSMFGCKVYNNTFVGNVIARASAIRFEEFEVPFPGLEFKNNLLLFRGPAVVGQANLGRYKNNLWWNLDKKGFKLGDHLDFESWIERCQQESEGGKLLGAFKDPQVILPKGMTGLPKNTQDIPAMKAFRLKPGSPARGKALPVAVPKGLDLWGKPLKGKKLNLGAWQA
jgi:hypothetical protein